MIMTRADIDAATDALARWFHNQGIVPADAAFVMAIMIGEIVRGTREPADLHKAIDLLRTVMMKTAGIK